MLNDTQRFRCPANVAARVLDGEAIMIHLESGRYFSAEGVGAALWQLLDSGLPFREVVAKVAESSGVSHDRAQEDVDRFVAELVREELLVTDQETAGAAAPGVVADLGSIPYSAPTLHAYRDMADLLALDPPMPSLKPMT